MSPTEAQVQTLIASCEQFRASRAPGGYPESLALCVIDSVQSTGVTYASVVKVVNGYRRYREGQGANPAIDGVLQLLATFDQLRGPDKWADTIGNRNRTSTHAGAPLKALAIRDAAHALSELGIKTTQELRDAAEDGEQFSQIDAAWRSVVGQQSGITWHYVQMLAGIPGIKPDRMITRFVADTLGLTRRTVTPDFALSALHTTAEAMQISPSDLDHGIWQSQRLRR
ncbi:hypothetical protein HZU40_22430 [Mycolicibacterium fluoranthenivorans]|uniref:Heme peroxidase n=1 Tax=Mycolicibacterium fluoranthenivorans TaxID=258505 RepID=A0A7G8P9F7_9MYCO|nr:hypothetical protein [Mycolicibacterium fluoranthenivorans]QNJ90973.1 hypothetical protein HZU40_22430 [Mycolicibacterium fluoranthenivorans]